jgi:hypothetical protein
MFVYGMAIDAIFMCFLYDEEHAKSAGTQAKHCPESLREFLDSYDAQTAPPKSPAPEAPKK